MYDGVESNQLWKISEFSILICVDFVKSDDDFDLCSRHQDWTYNKELQLEGLAATGREVAGRVFGRYNVKVEEIDSYTAY